MRALLLLLALASCAPVARGDSPTPRSLTGTRWVMVQGTHGQYSTPTLEFADASRANGFTGCNQWFAQVDRSNNGMRFDAMGMTRRSCDPAAMEIESDFADRLAQVRAAQIGENQLTFTDENGDAVATFERAT